VHHHPVIPRLVAVLLAVLAGTACDLFSETELTDPVSVPRGYTAVPGGGCGVAFPSEWKRDNLIEGAFAYEGSDGKASLHFFTGDPEPLDDPLPEFVQHYTDVEDRPLDVVTRETASVAGAHTSYRFLARGPDGVSHRVLYAYDGAGSECWLLITPGDDERARTIEGTFRVSRSR
jgi:hypothetical protein